MYKTILVLAFVLVAAWPAAAQNGTLASCDDDDICPSNSTCYSTDDPTDDDDNILCRCTELSELTMVKPGEECPRPNPCDDEEVASTCAGGKARCKQIEEEPFFECACKPPEKFINGECKFPGNGFGRKKAKKPPKRGRVFRRIKG